MFKNLKNKLETLGGVKGLKFGFGLKKGFKNGLTEEGYAMNKNENIIESPDSPINEKSVVILDQEGMNAYLKNMDDMRRVVGFLEAHLKNLNEEIGKRELVKDLDTNLPQMMELCSEMIRVYSRHEEGFKSFVHNLAEENARLKDEISVTKNELSAVKKERSMILRDNSEMIQRISKELDSIKESVSSGILGVNENLEGLRKEISPVMPAIQTSQEMIHGNKSGMQNPNAKINEEEFRRLAEEEMLSASEISRRLGVSVPAVTKKAKKLGIILVKGSNKKGMKNW